jgi:hypothetical protein
MWRYALADSLASLSVSPVSEFPLLRPVILNEDIHVLQ